MENRKCVLCGADYTPTNGRQKYCPPCSKEERKRRKRIYKRDYDRRWRERYTAAKRLAQDGVSLREIRFTTGIALKGWENERFGNGEAEEWNNGI